MINMILKVYFLKDMIIVCGQKIKKNRVIRNQYLSDMSTLEGDEEEVKERKGLNRLPLLLAQIEAGNSLNKLNNEIRQILYFLYQHNKITKKFYNNLIKPL